MLIISIPCPNSRITADLELFPRESCRVTTGVVGHDCSLIPSSVVYRHLLPRRKRTSPEPLQPHPTRPNFSQQQQSYRRRQRQRPLHQRSELVRPRFSRQPVLRLHVSKSQEQGDIRPSIPRAGHGIRVPRPRRHRANYRTSNPTTAKIRG